MLCSDLETYSPPDYNPDFGSDWLPLVTDPAIRQWAKDVNGLWAYLSRIVSTSAHLHVYSAPEDVIHLFCLTVSLGSAWPCWPWLHHAFSS